MDTNDTATTFPAGTHITATVTGTNGGKRFFRTRSFVLARDSIEREFIAAREGVPAEDRIFVQCSYGSVPELVVTGSIRHDEFIDGQEVGVSVDHFGREI